MTSDPFTLAYDYIETYLKESVFYKIGLAEAAFKIKTYRRKTSWFGRNLGEGDLPQVLVQPGNGTFDLDHSSSTIEVFSDYNILISSQTYDVGEAVYPVVFGTLLTVNKLHHDSELSDLKWCNEKYVIGTRLIDRTDGHLDFAQFKGQGGLASLLTLSVQMVFQRAVIKEYETWVMNRES